MKKNLKIIIAVLSKDEHLLGLDTPLVEKLLQRSLVFLEPQEVANANFIAVDDFLRSDLRRIVKSVFNKEIETFKYEEKGKILLMASEQIRAAREHGAVIVFVSQLHIKSLLLDMTAFFHKSMRNATIAPEWLTVIGKQMTIPEVIVLEQVGVHEKLYLMTEQSWIDDFLFRADDFLNEPALIIARGARFIYIESKNQMAIAEEGVKETVAKAKPILIGGLQKLHTTIENLIKKMEK